MLPPLSITSPIRIINSTEPQSPTQLTYSLDQLLLENNDPLSTSVPSVSRALYSSPSRSQFGKSIQEDGGVSNLEEGGYIGSFPGEENDFNHSAPTTAAPTRHPSPSPTKTHRQGKIIDNDKPTRRVIPPTLAQRRGRSGSTHQIRLWPLKTFHLHHAKSRSRSQNRRRSISNVRNVGHKPKELKRVGKERCWTWVTSSPPSIAPPLSNVSNAEEEKQSDKEHLLRLVDSVITNVQNSLDDLAVEENTLFLHHQHDLSILDMEEDVEMFRLEGKMADLEECLERVKSLRDDVGFEHRWECVKCDGGMEIYVQRRLKECFERSTWWTDYDPLQGQK